MHDITYCANNAQCKRRLECKRVLVDVSFPKLTQWKSFMDMYTEGKKCKYFMSNLVRKSI